MEQARVVLCVVRRALAVVYGVPQDPAGRSRLHDRDSSLRVPTNEAAFKGRCRGLEARAAKVFVAWGSDGFPKRLF